MSNNEYRPRRPPPRNWWEKLFDWPARVRLRISLREEAMLEHVQSWPLPIRSVLAGFSVVFAIMCVAVPATLGDADFRRASELVVTQPHEPARLLDVAYGPPRGSDTYSIWFRDEELEADYGWFIDDPMPGMTVDVVQDPEDSTHIIVVGTPQDWADKPWLTVVLWVVALGVGLVAAFFAGIMFLPEEADPVFEKFFDVTDRFVRWVDRTLQRWFGGGDPPTGRHASE
ncbi:hypothetical protein [Paeniglutamicibacter sp. NPDC091659]|uniref:hypothetical protein n=1 Tax=Paeniglutamicibacter sp. NPDC091659 TaxID=3364389 RepID=UPI00380BFD68